ncbi:uroporphyrinogen-III synthase [Chitinophaga terrae (ex Kim and Jung 2007)]|uniref:Uroporphyrinogen-III synthase n=1 Tax=Chitinophaga terrae (ex Kim and Jung 2007) TaxID=408074 RepID=A0A1H4C070_9BACT|nr:uroporphyrinogen-III synthase [Chitinophaga terrae (ex Kim and Jung 2007)]GEP91954.1 hypothetical protein CTE07_35990 [Chitinophaga terrae (ex Kim and Jung 2007)]SEA53831.1 uroporphyrinogen-III synthase [Chitinophaga terrae (ex Kim and Jung 2007)]
MQNKTYRILCTRPLSASLIEAATSNGIQVEVKEFIQIRPLIDERLLGTENLLSVFAHDDSRAQVFTSANAVKTLEFTYFNRPDTYYAIANMQVCCIDGNTLKQVEKHFQNCRVLATASYGKDLAEKILALPQIREVNFFCGSQRRDELPGILTAGGIKVNEYVIYENIPVPTVAGSEYDGILFFSPSAVKSFFSANRIPPATVCFAIGSTTARALEEHTDNKIISSTYTSEESMVQTAIFYFNNINCYE